MASIEDALGPIDVLVNNAGVAVSKGVLEQTEADWDKVVGTNLKGAFFVAQAVAKRMVAREPKPACGGSIVNIASVLALDVVGHLAPYAASKGGLWQLTRTMALELARYNIRVNALAPGYIVTEINRDFLATEAGERMKKRIPQRRFGTPEDLDGALLLLASDASRYMTGSIIVIDGGLHAGVSRTRCGTTSGVISCIDSANHHASQTPITSDFSDGNEQRQRGALKRRRRQAARLCELQQA